MRELVAEKIGFGLGTRDNQNAPQCSAGDSGEPSRARRAPSGAHDWETDTIVVIGNKPG